MIATSLHLKRPKEAVVAVVVIVEDNDSEIVELAVVDNVVLSLTLADVDKVLDKLELIDVDSVVVPESLTEDEIL